MAFPHLPVSDLHALLGRAVSRISRRDHQLKSVYHQFEASSENKRVYEISDAEIWIMQKSGVSALTAHVGFPFPLISQHIQELDGGIEVSVHLVGEEIRHAQREFLATSLDADLEGIGSDEFRFAVHKEGEHRDFIFVDSYDFTGDSFIGLHFRDMFLHQFGRSACPVFSRYHKHLNSIEVAYEKSIPSIKQYVDKDTMIIIPDLIDNHFGFTTALLQELIGTGAIAAVLGRNLLISLDAKPRVLWRVSEDPLLRRKNIEDYMNDCVIPFVPCLKQIESKYPNFSKSAFVNPLTSLPQRDLTPESMYAICQGLYEKGITDITISRGVKGLEKDRKWCHELEGLLKNAPCKQSTLLYQFSDLANITDTIRNKEISFGISADTSLSHLFNRINLPNIVVCKDGFWDSESCQSLTGDSPLGFARYFRFQLPIILKESSDSINETVSAIQEIVQGVKTRKDLSLYAEYLHGILHPSSVSDIKITYDKLQLLHSELSASLPLTAKAYNPTDLVGKIFEKDPIRARFLVYSAFKISPLYKLVNNAA